MGDNFDHHIGIDVGTTSAKVILVNKSESKEPSIVSSWSETYCDHDLTKQQDGKENDCQFGLHLVSDLSESHTCHGAGAADGSDMNRCDTVDEESAGRSEQHPLSILRTVRKCLLNYKHDHPSSQLKSISICGQMHGVVLWSRCQGQGSTHDESGSKRLGWKISYLINWQDQRCTEKFLQSLPTSSGPFSTGYGCASLFWLQRHRPDHIAQFDYAGTIADLLIVMLCDSSDVVMSDQNAASWGYYDIPSNTWQTDVLESASFPTSLLPTIVPVSSEAGTTSGSLFGLKDSIPVYVASGDSQCSAISTRFNQNQAVLNLGTSCQLIFMSDSITSPAAGTTAASPHLQTWPYKGSKRLSVVASMNGGNVLSSFVGMLKGWLLELDANISEDAIWSKISSMSEPTSTENPLDISPTFIKERSSAEPFSGAHIANILPTNTSLAQVYQQLCAGIIKNIAEMFPVKQLKESGIEEILCTGSVFTKHPYMLTAVKQIYSGLGVSRTKLEVNAAFGSVLMSER